MKRLTQILCFVALTSLFVGCNSCNNSYQFIINGNFGGTQYNGKMVYLYNFEDPANALDSAVITDGQFTLNGTVNEPWVAVVGNMQEGFAQQFIVEPGKIFITPDSIGGTPMNDDLNAMIKKFEMEEVQQQMEELMPLYYTADDATRPEVEKQLDSLNKIRMDNISSVCWEYYNKNHDNLVGVMTMEMISQIDEFTYTQFDSIVKTASPKVAESKAVQTKLEQLRSVDATSVGKHYTDIEGVDGKLSDIIDGKLAIIDFWASWCNPCRKEIKETLIPIWKKYQKKGLVVVGVNVWERGDQAAREEAYTKAVKELGITYPQLVDSTRNATTAYGVQSIPQILLIGPDGTILARDIRGAEIEEAVMAALK